MIDISIFMKTFTESLRKVFGDRLFFVGLQGSYGRGEATEKSDIDTVVILDKVNGDDIRAYNNVLDSMPYRELLCGFFSGKAELLVWEPSDLFQFYYDTKPIVGDLDELLNLIDAEAIERAIRIGACNIYHGCVHNMLYDKSEEILTGLYKSASFVLQAIAFRNTGKYYAHQRDLFSVVPEADHVILETFLKLKNGAEVKFDIMSDALFNRAQEWITNT